MEQILPLVKKYDAAIIALPNDADEIPMEVEKRIVLTRKIIEVATTEYGIAAADIVIDPLAMPIGADQEVVNTTLETMRRIRDEFGVNMTCGASNVSFGMPAPARARRGVPADGDDRRPHQRDHGHPHPADRRGGQGRRPAARPRRVGWRLDRRPPARQAGRQEAAAAQ